MPDYSAVRAQLETQLDVLLKRTDRIESDLRKLPNPDWVEQASESENDEVLEGLDALARDEVRGIRLALRRIREGTYGHCVSCGGSIGAARLAALPTTSTCVACAG